MKEHETYQGKFYSSDSPKPPRRRKKPSKKKQWLLRLAVIVAAVLLLILLAVAGILLHNHKAEKDLESLAAQVNAYTTEVETTGATTEATTETTVDTTVPMETQPKEILPQYADLAAQNSEMVGWLRVDGTKLDYPVMHSPEDPQKYLHTNFEEEYSYPGIPFIDAKCSLDSDNLLIYGHNMPNGTMFRSLLLYQQKNYWEYHPTIHFDTLYEEQEYEIVAAFYDRVYLKTETDVFKFYQFIDAEDEEDFDNAIAQFKSKALYDTDVTAEYGDKLITLVTCAYHTDNGRFVVVAKRMNEEA